MSVYRHIRKNNKPVRLKNLTNIFKKGSIWLSQGTALLNNCFRPYIHMQNDNNFSRERGVHLTPCTLPGYRPGEDLNYNVVPI